MVSVGRSFWKLAGHVGARLDLYVVILWGRAISMMINVIFKVRYRGIR